MVGPGRHSCAAILGAGWPGPGSTRSSPKTGGAELIGLALLIELMVRPEARMLEDGGFFDDGVFGYDFSEGYTSLEGSAAKVRPYRESAPETLAAAPVRPPPPAPRRARPPRSAGWTRSSRSSTARAATALTDEEHRFLVRVSAKYKKRVRGS